MSCRVAVVGSRGGVPSAAVAAFVRALPASCSLVSGGARGVDSFAVKAARLRGLPFREFLPSAPMRSAYLARNVSIVQNADVVIAFWDGVSTGTMHTVSVARRLGVPVVVVRGPVWCLASALLLVSKFSN